MATHIERQQRGRTHGEDLWTFALRSTGATVLQVTNYGAIVTALHTPDRHGQLADIVLGFDEFDDYLSDHPSFGAVVGRVANRIRGGELTLDGTRYLLETNDGPDHLHGGARGFDKVVWDVEATHDHACPAVTFRYRSPDGEAGYPGNLTTRVSYRLYGDETLRVEMTATTDRPTLVNLAQHCYWNLAGPGARDILDHELTLHARRYTPGAPRIPDGRVEDVAGTPFDFTGGKPIGADIAHVGDTPGGFDHNFVVDGPPGTLRPVARLMHPGSGRVLCLDADQPGVQLYTGNFLDGTLHGKTTTYDIHAGLCLETQAFPNAINVPAWRDQVVLRPGGVYRHTMQLRFQTTP